MARKFVSLLVTALQIAILLLANVSMIRKVDVTSAKMTATMEKAVMETIGE